MFFMSLWNKLRGILQLQNVLHFKISLFLHCRRATAVRLHGPATAEAAHEHQAACTAHRMPFVGTHLTSKHSPAVGSSRGLGFLEIENVNSFKKFASMHFVLMTADKQRR